ncbi:hypothetical protein TKK_0017659 [Trichogramma kaykai]
MLVDGGAVSSWIGEGPATMLEKKIRQTASFLEGPLGEIVKADGKVKLTLNMDGIELEHNFKVSKGLNYDIIMGIDLQIKFGLILNNRELTWTSWADITHPYYPELINETYTVEAIAAIGGLRDADEYQKDEITRIIDELIPPPTDTLPAANIKPHKIDVEGHGPIRQKYRKIPYNLQMAAHAEIDKLLKEDIITESKSPWCSCPIPTHTKTKMSTQRSRDIRKITRPRPPPMMEEKSADDTSDDDELQLHNLATITQIETLFGLIQTNDTLQYIKQDDNPKTQTQDQTNDTIHSQTTPPTQYEPNTNTPTQNTTPTDIHTSPPTPESTIPFKQIFPILKEPSQYSGTIPKQNIKKKVRFEPHPFENSPRKKERMILQNKRDEERRELLQKFPNIEAKRTLFIQPTPTHRAQRPKQTYSDEDFTFPTTTTTKNQTPIPFFQPTPPTQKSPSPTESICPTNDHPTTPIPIPFFQPTPHKQKPSSLIESVCPIDDYHANTKRKDERKIRQDELKRQSIGKTADCWTCLKPGHKARDCPEKKAKSICWKCDKTGHFWYECQREAEEDFCITCGRVGTNTEACPNCQEIEIRRRRNEIRKLNDTTQDVPYTPRPDATHTTTQTYRRPALLPTPSMPPVPPQTPQHPSQTPRKPALLPTPSIPPVTLQTNRHSTTETQTLSKIMPLMEVIIPDEIKEQALKLRTPITYT